LSDKAARGRGGVSNRSTFCEFLHNDEQQLSSAGSWHGPFPSTLACIIREAVEEWFWGGEITAKMLAAA
jgi:hypothetical protein